MPPNPTAHPLYPLACRLRPGLLSMDDESRLQAFAEVFATLYMAPIALISLIWLAASTSGKDFLISAVPLVLLTIGLAIVNRQTADLLVELEPHKYVRISGSLGNLILWASLLVWGPVILWAELFANLILGIREGWRRGRFNRDVFWAPLATYVQEIGTMVTGGLLGLMAYRALGGETPFSALEPAGWIAPLTAIGIDSIVPAIVTLPLMLQISRLANIPVTAFSLRTFFFSIVVLGLVPTPFAIPISLLYTRGGLSAFVFGLVGLVLVNLLAHHLSRSNNRSQQQSREMTQLEKLGEAILQAPPDGSTLTETLQTQMEAMFVSQLDMLEIIIFDPLHLPGLAVKDGKLHLFRPAQAASLPDSVWQDLRESESAYLVLKNHLPQGMKESYGDAILVKILDAAPVTSPACIGGIYLLRHKDEARTLDSLPTIQALASQIASAIYRAQVYEETLAAQKMSQELAFAGTIQSGFLPEIVPTAEGWSLAAALIPARQTSGDFYDFIPLPDGKIGLLVADVADKGTGAALYMALSRTLLRTFAFQYPAQPAEAFCQANERILADSRANQFVTVFYGVLDPPSGTLTYANAGHNPPLILRAFNPQAPELLLRTGMALGVTEEQTWGERTISLNPGDLLVLYTDGVTEAQNSADEFFGDARLLESACSHRVESADDIHSSILESIRSFVGDEPQSDDITLIAVKRE